jgi:hypothetical protein
MLDRSASPAFQCRLRSYGFTSRCRERHASSWPISNKIPFTEQDSVDA